MSKHEAKFTLLFRHWLRSNPMLSAVFELKQCGSTIAFDAIQPHQIDALLAAKSPGGLLYKIPDDSAGYKPCDLVYLRSAHAYVVILFRRHAFFAVIDIDVFLRERDIVNSRKSLTFVRAREIATKIVTFKKKGEATIP